MKQETVEPKKFTGFHATVMIVAFFTVVVSVNMVMARFAVSTFGGTVVDNSYVASQKYNEWLEESRKQQAHGWTASRVTRIQDKVAMTVLRADDSALEDAEITAVAEHPVGRADPIILHFVQQGAGSYISRDSLPEGRWKLRIAITHGGNKMALAQEVL
ncbi:FixH family protein [Parasphingorhabdus cellanae]|uniref:FixH family protein n=1 Tax=Parasphingorhabdus cellanae TaxID=2806553 RepID=A0ABX7T799_9SPHN|nr:FixH family protein [Parasphingorhabdus cellanae]QTD56996.1 FixH family protein [Parasphingorhabdus cellanae]